MSARAALREPMLWLVVALPALAVVAGLGTVWIASRGPPDRMDSGVRRVAQVQTSDLAPDLDAAARGIEARIEVDRRDGGFTLRIAGAQAGTLQLWLRHPGDARRDLHAIPLPAADGLYRASLGALGAGPWNLTLTGAPEPWRVTGRLPPGARSAILRPAVHAR